MASSGRGEAFSNAERRDSRCRGLFCGPPAAPGGTEPVSAGKFPFIREIIGNFAKRIALWALRWRQNGLRFSGLVKKSL
jgi:hypothetical protein